MSLGFGKSLKMTTVNDSDSSFYVQSLKVNVEYWTKSWLTWNDIFANGGTMDFVLGENPANWTSGPPPPSPASEFSVDTPASATIPPDSVLMAPNHKGSEIGGKRKNLLRSLAFGLMAVVIALSSAGIFTFWWYKLRKSSENTDTETRDQGKEENGSNREVGPLNRIRKYLDWRNWNLGKTQPPADLPPPNLPLTTEVDTISGSVSDEIGMEIKR